MLNNMKKWYVENCDFIRVIIIYKGEKYFLQNQENNILLQKIIFSNI